MAARIGPQPLETAILGGEREFYEAPLPSRFGKLYGKAETNAPAFVIPLLLSVTMGRLKYDTARARSRFEVDRRCGPAPNVLHAHCEARWDRLRGFVQTPEMEGGRSMEDSKIAAVFLR
jgi:hypothetical protein